MRRQVLYVTAQVAVAAATASSYRPEPLLESFCTATMVAAKTQQAPTPQRPSFASGGRRRRGRGSRHEMVTATATEFEVTAPKASQSPHEPSQKNPKLVAFTACVLWVSIWLVLPVLTTTFLLVRFGWMWASAFWICAGVIPPSLPPQPRVRRFFQRMLEWVESSEIIGKLENTTGKPTLYCHHPHGIVCISAVVHGSKPSGVNAIVAPAVFKIPFCRQLMECMGSIPADKESMKKALKTRRDFAIVPGGVEEVALCSRDVERSYILNRKGFIKYAMEFGYDLQPCYHFGETQQYSIAWPLDTEWCLRWRVWLAAKTQLAVGAGWGHWLLPLIPRQEARCLTVVGPRITVPHNPQPSDEEVKALHGKYVAALHALYMGHRHRLPAYRDKDLQLW